jgi:hypothetical protein
MMKRQFCERAYFRACSLPTRGFLSSDYVVLTQRPTYASEAAWINQAEREGFR